MIKAQELRLGNIVLRDGEYHVIDAYDILSASVGDIEFEGVVLTGDVLARCGFEDDSYANFIITMPDNPLSNFKSNARWIRISFKEYACLNLQETIDITDYDISAPCKYLHQLQNLFFSICGEELVINFRLAV